MKNMLDEFKEFALKGNLIELAVAVILALAFSGVINSLVIDIVLPFIAAIVGQPNFEILTVNFNDSIIRYGQFLTLLVDFLLVALVLVLHREGRQPATASPGGRAGPRDPQLPPLLYGDSGGRDPVQRVHERGHANRTGDHGTRVTGTSIMFMRLPVSADSS